MILVSDCIFENLITNNTNDVIMITVINPSKYSPLSGSFANEWTLSIIPERTIKAPNKLNEKTKIDNNSVHTLNLYDFIETLSE